MARWRCGTSPAADWTRSPGGRAGAGPGPDTLTGGPSGTDWLATPGPRVVRIGDRSGRLTPVVLTDGPVGHLVVWDVDEADEEIAGLLQTAATSLALVVDRVTELLGPDWRDPDRVLQLQLALVLRSLAAALPAGG